LGKVTQRFPVLSASNKIDEIRLSFHVFPEDADDEKRGEPFDSDLYPDLALELKQRKVSSVLKRCLDVAGSLAALVAASPLLVAISIAIKLTRKAQSCFGKRESASGVRSSRS